MLAPLSLNAPPVCRHSHLSQTRVPPISLSISGVRSTRPKIRSAAATTSFRETSSSFAKRLIFHPFDYPLQISDIWIENLNPGLQKSLQQ